MPGNEPVLTAAQMRQAEQALIAQGVSVNELMRRAGEGAAEWVWRMAAGGSVTVLCGPGNNGGDGYVIAQTLRARGLPVCVIAPMEPTTDAARNARARWTGDVITDADGAGGRVLVDCLFGSGLSRPLLPEHASLIAELAARHQRIVAVDLPSGVATDDGALLGDVVRCDLTLALGAWKPAHFLMPALSVVRTAKLVTIGALPDEFGALFVKSAPRLCVPERGAHKYSRGFMGIVGGEMAGAAQLASKAAVYSGAGYVKLFAAEAPPNAPSALVVESGDLAQALGDKRLSALLIGPGLGRSEAARNKLAIVLGTNVATVIDADALHLLDDDLLEGVDTTRLLITPHEGELNSLCKAFGIEEKTKRRKAEELAARTGMTVLAKGPDTLLATPDAPTMFFPPAPTWLASAGTGDVLAGIVASRLSTGKNSLEAASEAVWLHAEAARVAGPALIADDLAAAVPKAYARLL